MIIFLRYDDLIAYLFRIFENQMTSQSIDTLFEQSEDKLSEIEDEKLIFQSNIDCLQNDKHDQEIIQDSIGNDQV